MTRDKIVAMLKDYGHSVAKALEIAIDYERKIPHAIRWVETIKKVNSIAPGATPGA